MKTKTTKDLTKYLKQIQLDNDSEHAREIIELFQKPNGTELASKSVSVLSKSTFFKMIGFIYQELLEKKDSRDLPFSTVAFRIIAKRYSSNKRALKKFSELVKTSLQYSQELRIKTFCKFLGVLSFYDQATVAIFLRLLGYFSDKATEITKQIIQGQKTMVPIVNIYDVLRVIFNDFEASFHEKLKEKLEKIKDSDGSSSLRSFLDFDKCAEVILEHFNLFRHLGPPIEAVFFEMDLDGQGNLSFGEVEMITRHLEPEYFEKNSVGFVAVLEKFSEGNEDKSGMNKEKREMSLKNFKAFCEHERLFAKGTLEKFEEKTRKNKSQSPLVETNDILKGWKSFFKPSFTKALEACSVSESFRDFFRKIEKPIVSFDEIYSRKLWFSVKILEMEVVRIFQK